MIDIHAHILPGMDDGAEDPYDSLDMAGMAADCGVSTIIATPHCDLTGLYENEYNDEYRARFRELQELLSEREIPVTLLAGMEIYLTRDTADRIRSGRLISLNDSGRYLVEFDFDRSFGSMTDRLAALAEQGIRLIVAHPERYHAVQRHPERVLTWIDMGCQLQINRGSILGRFGRDAYETAHILLRNDLVTYVASDAHSPYRRTTFLADAYEYLAEEYSRGIARRLLRENQERFLIHREN